MGNVKFAVLETGNSGQTFAADITFISWSSIGHMWSLPMPNIDAVIQIASTMLGIDFLNTGLTSKDLGIEDMSPTDLKALVQ